jgi:hypothetical protein
MLHRGRNAVIMCVDLCGSAAWNLRMQAIEPHSANIAYFGSPRCKGAWTVGIRAVTFFITSM